MGERARSAAVFALVLAAAASGAALGQAPGGSAGAAAAGYPTKPIRLIVPFAPGGGTDVAARVIGRKLAETMGQQWVIENKAGAGGNIAAEQVAKSPGDGYTVFFGAIGPLSISPSLYRNLPYDPLRDFAAITMAVVFSNVLVIHPSVQAGNPQELLALARARPGTLDYGSSGNAGVGHLATAPTAIPQIKAGKIRALGVTSGRRIAALPDVPTIAEAAIPGYEVLNWYCFVAPAKTPPEIVRRLNQEIHKAMASPDVRDNLLAQGMDPTPTSPEELAAFIKAEAEKWSGVVRERKISVD